jgi:hypothetical protein
MSNDASMIGARATHSLAAAQLDWSWVDTIDYNTDTTIVPHRSLLVLRKASNGEREKRLAVPSAALSPTIIARLLRGIGSGDVQPFTVACIDHPSTPLDAVHDAYFAAYHSLVRTSNQTSLVQPWLLLSLMHADNAAERQRLLPELRRISKRYRCASAALQCTARLLCCPDLVRLSLRNPLFNWRFVYEQHRLNFILANMSDVVRACIAAAASSHDLHFDDVALIITHLASRAIPHHFSTASSILASPVIVEQGPSDSVPLVAEQLLPSMPSAAALSKEPIYRAVRAVRRRSERDDADLERTTARQRRCTRQQRVASEGEEKEAQQPYVVDEIMGVKVECGKLLCKVRWHGYGPEDNTWEPWGQFKLAVGEFLTEQVAELARVRQEAGQKEAERLALLQELQELRLRLSATEPLHS